jgi:signal transduction histidine kinase
LLNDNKIDRRGAILCAAIAHLALLAAATPAAGNGVLALLLIGTGLAVALVALAADPAQTSDVYGATDRVMTALEPAAMPEPEIAAPAAVRQPPLAAAPVNVHNADWADLMARVSHELRTPLNAVLGFSDLMDRGLFGPLGHQRYQEYARHIHESGRELLKSAEDTLAVTSLLAAPGRHRPTEIVDLEALIADAWAFVAHAPHGCRPDLQLAIERGTEVLGDRRTLRQALVNLLTEARLRSCGGGAVRIEAAPSFGGIVLSVSVSPVTPVAADVTVRDPVRDPGSLHICLARTLLEFHAAELDERISAAGRWEAVTRLELASQHDFFAPHATDAATVAAIAH